MNDLKSRDQVIIGSAWFKTENPTQTLTVSAATENIVHVKYNSINGQNNSLSMGYFLAHYTKQD